MTGALLLAALAAAAPPPSTVPPIVARVEAGLSASRTARRLLAAAAEVPRRETRRTGLPLAIDVRGGESPEILFDAPRVEELPPAEAEAQYALALARAAIASPVPLIEAEQAAWQWTAQAAVERAADEPARAMALRAVELQPSAESPVLSEAAAFLALFERDPMSAYWRVESGQGLPREAARLAELEDLAALRGRELRALPAPPAGPYGELGGRRYPAALVRAAWRLRHPGRLERLREALGAYDSVGWDSLRESINRWRRGLPG